MFLAKRQLKKAFFPSHDAAAGPCFVVHKPFTSYHAIDSFQSCKPALNFLKPSPDTTAARIAAAITGPAREELNSGTTAALVIQLYACLIDSSVGYDRKIGKWLVVHSHSIGRTHHLADFQHCIAPCSLSSIHCK